MSDRPSVTDNARADLHPVVTEHQIIGTQTGKQGAGQVVPEDSVLCIKCGWMRCSDYTWHLSDALRAARAETTTVTSPKVASKDDETPTATTEDALADLAHLILDTLHFEPSTRDAEMDDVMGVLRHRLTSLDDSRHPHRAQISQYIYRVYHKHIEDNDLALRLTEAATDAVLSLLVQIEDRR